MPDAAPKLPVSELVDVAKRELPSGAASIRAASRRGR